MSKLISLLTLAILLTGIGFAQVELPIPEPEQFQQAQICGPDTNIQQCIAQIFTIIFKAFIWVSGAAAVIMFIWAGFIYITKGTSEDERKKANNILIYGAVGIVIALVSYVLVQLLARFAQQGQLGA